MPRPALGRQKLSDMNYLAHLYFADKTNAIIELKSKNVNIDSLLGLKHNRRTVISWSMNSQVMHSSEEGFSASMEDRLVAAAEVQKAGYKLGFHFDPMLDHPGWQEGYRDIVDKIFRSIFLWHFYSMT